VGEKKSGITFDKPSVIKKSGRNSTELNRSRWLEARSKKPEARGQKQEARLLRNSIQKFFFSSIF
jgi:hypothetical protein